MLLLNPNEIQRLWEILPHPPGTYIRWFARKGEERMGGGTDTVLELYLAAEALLNRYNFYVAPNPASTRVGTRHRAEQVSHWSWFLMDIDPVEELARPDMVVDFVLARLSEWWGIDFRTRRPVIINSGRGMQIWIRLPDYVVNHPCIGMPNGEVLEFDDGMVTNALTARVTNGYWLKRLADTVGTMNGCRIDTTCADLPRVMRCPGTVNQKNFAFASFVVDTSEVFTDLPRTMISAVPPEMFVPPPVITLPEGTPWQNVFAHLTLRAQDYLTYGKEEPGRHDTMFHVALTLGELGLPRDEVRRALQHGNELWDRRHGTDDRALEPKDIEHALDTAFRRLLRDGKSVTMEVGAEGSPTQT